MEKIKNLGNQKSDTKLTKKMQNAQNGSPINKNLVRWMDSEWHRDHFSEFFACESLEE